MTDERYIKLFILAIVLYVVVLNVSLVFSARPRFFFKKENSQGEVLKVVFLLLLFIASFWLGIQTYIMKLFNSVIV